MKRYGNCPTVVFDGGYDAASTKDTTHVRRAKGRNCKEVRIQLNNPLSISKNSFLLNKSNKQNFLLLLGNQLTKNGIVVDHASGDSDLLIVQTALLVAKDYPTVIIGEDTDLLVLALHHFKDEEALFFTSEPKQSQRQSAEVWNIGHAKQILGDICHGLLVVHAFSRCDTTSHIHSVGKPAVLQKYRNSMYFQSLTKTFLNPSAKRRDIVEAGEKIMLDVTGATTKEKTMDEKRLATYYKKLGGKSAVKPKSLGPTSDATGKHSERVYHTVQGWRGNDLPSEQWGWEILNGIYIPVQMTKPPAPDELLKIIRCARKVECTARCTCITYGLKCTSTCIGCRGVSCQNCVPIDLDLEA